MPSQEIPVSDQRECGLPRRYPGTRRNREAIGANKSARVSERGAAFHNAIG